MKVIIFTLFWGVSFSFFLNAQEKVCQRCEEIREYNAKHHKNYEYYEDYLKENSGFCRMAEDPKEEQQELEKENTK